MTRLHYRYGLCGQTKPRELIKVITCIMVQGNKYVNSTQAAITIAWIIVNNLDSRYGGKISYHTGWDEDKRKKVYKRALRLIKPICKRILNEND